jgi:hypothetical protein
MMKTTFARIHKGLVVFIALGTFLQMFLAGAWHAKVLSTPDAHVYFGLSMLLASLLALIAAAVGKLPRATIGRTGLLFFLILLQPFLMEARRNGLPFVSAFHALNAPFIGMTASMVLAMARSGQTEETGTAVSAAAGD